MRKAMFAALCAAVALTAATIPAQAGNKPLDIRTDVGRGLMVAAPAIGAGAGYWVGQGLAHAGPWQAGALEAVGGLGGAATIGFVGGVAALIGYEAIGCRTFGTDPFRMCLRHSWRDPNWRGH